MASPKQGQKGSAAIQDLLSRYRRLPVADRRRFDEALVLEEGSLSHRLQSQVDKFHRGRRVQQERVRRRNALLTQIIRSNGSPAKTLTDWEAIRRALIAKDCFLAINGKVPEEEKSHTWWEQQYLSARSLRDTYLRTQKSSKPVMPATKRAS